MRRTSLAALASLSPLLSAAYGFDAASRLQTVSDGNGNTATYSYLANSPLVSQITFAQSGSTRMTTTKQWDSLNRLTQISSSPSASYTPASTFNYSYNSANQRTKDVLNDGSYWVYQYDSLGQVTNGVKYWADGTPVAGQQFQYLFDTIGNRTQTMSGGDATGQNQRTAGYSANNLNQITQRDVPAFVDVMGASLMPFTNSITVNGQAAYRHGEYFRAQIPANNSASALWTNITVVGGQAVTGNVYVAQEPEIFKYDRDGNLTNDGRFTYSWDAENRLTNMTSLNSAPTASKVKLDFAYDYQGRRIQKTVWTNNGTAYVPECTNRFLYDGWNLIAVLNSGLRPLTSFTWGTDLSGSQQGAGGVGGLLEISEISNSQITNCFVAYDGNGNVMALVNTTDGTLAAEYDYGPFGELIRSTGPMATANPIRFSTKYQDDESDLLYYGYRYYKPGTGAWPNRDPIGEKGGINLYAFVWNEPVGRIDALGLYGNPGAGFREEVSCVCSCGISKCRKGAQLAQQALAEAAKRYPNSLHNGDGDAFRHCYWSCEMAHAIGQDCAKIIGDNHEAAGNRNGQPPAEYNMDSNNNSVGRSLASSSGDCGDLCKKALDDGKLTVINP